MSLSKRPDLRHFTSDFETVEIEIKNGNQQNVRSIINGVIYRPPIINVTLFDEKLKNTN